MSGNGKYTSFGNLILLGEVWIRAQNSGQPKHKYARNALRVYLLAYYRVINLDCIFTFNCSVILRSLQSNARINPTKVDMCIFHTPSHYVILRCRLLSFRKLRKHPRPTLQAGNENENSIFTSRSIHVTISAVSFCMAICMAILMSHLAVSIGCCCSSCMAITISIHSSVAIGHFRCIGCIFDGSNGDVALVIGLRCWWHTINFTKQTIVRTFTWTFHSWIWFIVSFIWRISRWSQTILSNRFAREKKRERRKFKLKTFVFSGTFKTQKVHF